MRSHSLCRVTLVVRIPTVQRRAAHAKFLVSHRHMSVLVDVCGAATPLFLDAQSKPETSAVTIRSN
jgi:hypothetical protein